MKVEAYIHSLKDKEHDRHVLGEAEIIKSIGNNLYLAEYNGVQCTAIFNAEKEVSDIHQRTREGIETARLKGKQIGLKAGTRLTTKSRLRPRS